MRGTVLSFNDGSGYGFVQPHDGSESCFAHFTEVKDKEEQMLFPGEEVEFSVQTDAEGRTQAKDIHRTENRERGIVETFQDGYGFIARSDGEARIFVHRSDIATRGYKRLEAGEDVTFAVVTGDKGPKAVRVRRLDTRRPLERFAFLLRYDERLQALVKLAQTENWNYRLTRSPQSFPILRSYLRYTFARLEDESKIATAKGRGGEEVACFNTGLVTERQEAIFAVFRPNKRTDREAAPQWVLDQFAKESDRILTCFARKPDIANYFADPRELLYDTRIELVVDFDHVIRDNRERFPAKLQDNDYGLKAILDGAIVAAKGRVRRNYKTAIPQYYRGRLQLLLPLCLLGPEQADLALVVAREGEVYRASTVLTLDMAYNNARLLARPDTEWLNP